MATNLCRLFIFFLLAGLVGSLQPAEAQFSKLKKRAKERVEENLGRKQDKAIDEAMGEGDSQAAPETQAASESQAASASEDAGASASSHESAGHNTASMKPGEGAWANYDFVPGERPLYVDDFTADVVGNFPQRMEFLSGNMEIVEWQGKRWLRAEDGEFYINLPEVLPERFTMEFDLAGSGNAMSITFEDDPNHQRRIQIDANNAWARSGEVNGQGELGVSTKETPVKIRIAVDGKYVKLYANEKRALNVPNAELGRSNRLYVHMNGWSAEHPRMIADLRIMAGGRKLYDALAAEGRVVTQGIYFDTGSDQLSPESTPTLKEIGQMLKDHPELRLGIEGHTDNTGSAEGNKSLSEKRAAAVRHFLITAYGVDGSRLESAGFGPEKPVGDNATAEGRQMNRRVELVKL